MKKLLMPVVAAAILFGAQAYAEDAAKPAGPDHTRGAARFKEADANKDGFLTKDEMLDAHKKRIDKMFENTDTDKDGKLSTGELEKGREAMRAKFKDRFKGDKPADAPKE